MDVWNEGVEGSGVRMVIPHYWCFSEVVLGYKSTKKTLNYRLGPYAAECNASRPIRELNLLSAAVVLGWGTTRERVGVPGTLFFFLLFFGGLFSNLFHSFRLFVQWRRGAIIKSNWVAGTYIHTHRDILRHEFAEHLNSGFDTHSSFQSHRLPIGSNVLSLCVCLCVCCC